MTEVTGILALLDESFDHWVGAKGVHKFYFGDHMEPSDTATTNPHS